MTVFSGADRRQWWGYTDIGPIQIPPNPQYLILTDRNDGVTLWWVTFNNPGSPPGGFVSVKSTLPADPPIDRPTKNAQDPRPFVYDNCALWPAYGEPVLGVIDGNYFARIFVRGGTLGVSREQFNPSFGYTWAAPLYLIQTVLNPVNPKLGYNGEYVQLILDITVNGTPSAPTYAWIPYTLTQTPNPAPVNSMANLSNPGADV
jgi:hypothetical protein